MRDRRRRAVLSLLIGCGTFAILPAQAPEQEVPQYPPPARGAAAMQDGAKAWQLVLDRSAQSIARHPELVSRIELGRSVQGRPLFVLRIGRQDDGVPEMYLGGAIHGHERSEQDVLAILEQLLARRDEPRIAQLLASRVLWAQPAVNPDALVAGRRHNARGVDLNRNFAARWRASGQPWQHSHPGRAPFSEPETSALRDFLLSRTQLRAYLDLHRSVQALVLPQVGDAAWIDDRARAVGDALQAVLAERSPQWRGGLLQAKLARGLTIDWLWDALGVMAVTMENRDPVDGPREQEPRWLAFLHLFEQAAEFPPRHVEPSSNGPVLVTAQTRKDEAELERLQRPGEVLCRDGFETEASYAAWFELLGRDQGRVAIATGDGVAHTGRGALQLTTEDRLGAACGAGARRWLGAAGRDCLHLSYYLRYAPDYDQGNLNHTGGSISGIAGDDRWRGMGSAGRRPKGDDHCSTRVEGWRDWQRTPAPGFLHSYTYWMDMRKDRDGHYWGNMLMPVPAERFVPPRDRWLCIEQRVELNRPEHADGELAVWIDGALYMHWRGIRWRSSDAVRLVRVALDLYVHESRQQNRVWYDDMVVSTGYVGPAR